MTFWEQVVADLSTFLNVDEFGESVEVDGSTMACVLNGDETPGNPDGIIEQKTTLYTKASNFAELPSVRQRLSINGRPANVVRVDEQQGILVLGLEWLDS